MAMIFDRPAGPRKDEASDPEKRKIVERYFHDLYGVIMKKLSEFTMESEPPADLGIKIQAMIQELIKVKRLLSETGTKKGE